MFRCTICNLFIWSGRSKTSLAKQGPAVLFYGTSASNSGALLNAGGKKAESSSSSTPKPVLRSVDDDLLLLKRKYSVAKSTGYRPGIILGIETSCDDTGVAVVNHEKQILGESLNAQIQIHLNHGGIIPPIAKHLHEQHIGRVIEEAMSKANITLNDVDAIATTVKPGLSLSLNVGVKRGKELCLKAKKPFIPIHHMEAHALTPRLLEEIEFPYMVLLISGGHCLLAVAKSINDFILLGKTIDDAPGEAFDKTARRLKLHNNTDASSISGGEAIEQYAKNGNPEAFHFPTPMHRHRDCNWSFAGLKFIAQRHILWEERKYEIEGSDMIPSINDFCASFQHAVVTHLCKKVQRGMIYADLRKLIGKTNRKLIVSGGVACNDYIKRGIDLVCKEMNYEMIVPPPHLCTDNGVMIAWNGVEKWNAEIDIIPLEDLESVEIEPKSPFGKDVYQDIRDLDIKCQKLPMKQIFESNPGHKLVIERNDTEERESIAKK